MMIDRLTRMSGPWPQGLPPATAAATIGRRPSEFQTCATGLDVRSWDGCSGPLPTPRSHPEGLLSALDPRNLTNVGFLAVAGRPPTTRSVHFSPSANCALNSDAYA